VFVEITMDKPPTQLDGADVLFWTVSEQGGFYTLPGSGPPIIVTGMAVARYVDGGALYLLKCDHAWQVVQDWDCGSVEEAQALAGEHSGNESLVWRGRA
jgi:hypothetical protein